MREERAGECAFGKELSDRVERDGERDYGAHERLDDARGVGRERVGGGGEPEDVMEVREGE